MATTLSFGYVRPEDGDKGVTFWGDLEDDITQLNGHNHDGANSAKLTAASSLALTQTVASGSWSAFGSGYRQLLTCPSGVLFDTMCVIFRDSTTGEQFFLDTTKVSASTFYVFINDNSKTLKAIYVT